MISSMTSKGKISQFLRRQDTLIEENMTVEQQILKVQNPQTKRKTMFVIQSEPERRVKVDHYLAVYAIETKQEIQIVVTKEVKKFISLN